MLKGIFLQLLVQLLVVMYLICRQHQTYHHLHTLLLLPPSHLLTEGNTPSFHAAAPESDISFFHIGVIVFMLSIVYRHASKASCRCSVDIAIATLISLTLRLPILCIAINFFTCHFFNT